MPERVTAWKEQQMINESRLQANGKTEWNAEQSSWVGNPNFNYRPNYSNGRWDFSKQPIGLMKVHVII